MSNSEGMASTAFRVTIDGDIAIIKLIEVSFAHFQAQEFDRLTDVLRDKELRRFVVDLSTCEYIASEGLTCTAAFWKWCHDEGNGAMTAIIPQTPGNEVKNLFDIIGLSRMIGSALQPTLSQALRYLKEFA